MPFRVLRLALSMDPTGVGTLPQLCIGWVSVCSSAQPVLYWDTELGYGVEMIELRGDKVVRQVVKQLAIAVVRVPSMRRFGRQHPVETELQMCDCRRLSNGRDRRSSWDSDNAWTNRAVRGQAGRRYRRRKGVRWLRG